MEDLLMASDSDSDNEEAVVVAPPAAAPRPAPVAAQAPAQVQARIPAPATNANVPMNRSPGMAGNPRQQAPTHNERLKSLYSKSKSTAPSMVPGGSGGAPSSQAGRSVGNPMQQGMGVPPPMQQSQLPPQRQQPPRAQPMQQQPQIRQQPLQQPQQQQLSRSQPQQRPSHRQHGGQQQQPPQYSRSQQVRPQYSQPQQHRQSSQQGSHRQSSQQGSHHQQPQPIGHRPQPSQPTHLGRQQIRTQPQSRGVASSQPQQADPYAPTPLDDIKKGHSHSQSRRSYQPQLQVQQPRQSSQPSSSVRGRQPGTLPSHPRATPMTSQEIKKQKEKFLMFTRVLIKYLEQKDKQLHLNAKKIIKMCAENNKKQVPGFESVTVSMRKHLRDLVGDSYWKKAEQYLQHFIKTKRANIQQQQQQSQARRAIAASQNNRQQAPTIVAPQQSSQPRTAARESQARPRAVPAASTRAPTAVAIQDKREPQTSQPAPTVTAKGTSKSRSKASTTAKGAASGESKSTTKTKTTKKTVRRKSAGDSSATTRKASTKTGSGQTVVTTIVKRTIIEEPPREYKELMEEIDHAVEYDWPSIGQLLGSKADLKLSDEERQLLYGDSPPDSLVSNKKKVTKTPTKTAAVIPATPSSAGQEQSSKEEAAEDKSPQQGDKEAPSGRVRPGWGKSNVLSARAAWSRIRLDELRQRKLEAESAAPVVAGGLLTLPSLAPPQQQPESKPATNKDAEKTLEAGETEDETTTANNSTAEADVTVPDAPKPTEIEGSWIDDESAEQDEALALLSEGCQIYLKRVLEKAVQCARQRQNLDGIRLWHSQYAHGKGTAVTTTSVLSKENKNKNSDKSKKPPLSLRLGCDVSRQVAQAQGNAALTVKRMEEALVRQTGIPMQARELQIDTFCEATSMGDLSWRPLLKQGADKADLHAKRAFEIYGGKEAKTPPFGRVPKKAKLLVEDFVIGSELVSNGPYHKAHTASSFIAF